MNSTKRHKKPRHYLSFSDLLDRNQNPPTEPRLLTLPVAALPHVYTRPEAVIAPLWLKAALARTTGRPASACITVAVAASACRQRHAEHITMRKEPTEREL